MDDLVKQALASLGIAPQFYVLLGALGIINAALKSYVAKWQRVHSLILAGVFGSAFGVALWIQQVLPPVEGLTKIVTLIAAATLVEFGLELLPALRNNANANTKPPTSNQGGYMRVSTLACVTAVLVFVAVCASFCHAGVRENLSLGVGPQVSYFSSANAPMRSQFEVGGGGALSLRPLVSLVSSVNYGFRDNYLRGDLGLSFSVYDEPAAVNGDQWSVGVGLRRQWYSQTDLGHNEWVASAALGWVTKVFEYPVVFTGLGGYGIESESARLTIAGSVPLKIAK